MLDTTRTDRDYLWGRIFGELSLWMDRAKLTSAQYETYIHDWSAHPASTFAAWMERYQMTVIESGAARGAEDKRIVEIMWHITADMMTDDPLGPDCFVAYYQERGERQEINQQPKDKTMTTTNEKYITEDYETGTAIDEFATYAEAMAAIAKYEATDRENDSYSEGFYAIRHGENVERVYDAADTIEREKSESSQKSE